MLAAFVCCLPLLPIMVLSALVFLLAVCLFVDLPCFLLPDAACPPLTVFPEHDAGCRCLFLALCVC